LLARCVRNDIKVFSSMGAGAKSDPTRIQIADLSATQYDPLARAVRQRLRAALSASPAREYSIPVVYSCEVPSTDVALLPLADSELAKGSVDELAPLRDFRVRILPVLGPLPALFGLHIATYVLCELAGRPLERPLPMGHRKKLYERLWKDLLHRESRIARKQIKFVLFLSLPISSSAKWSFLGIAHSH
jgi:tRNA A37 threonylcarbamoyladenosine dehydratase